MAQSGQWRLQSIHVLSAGIQGILETSRRKSEASHGYLPSMLHCLGSATPHASLLGSPIYVKDSAYCCHCNAIRRDTQRQLLAYATGPEAHCKLPWCDNRQHYHSSISIVAPNKLTIPVPISDSLDLGAMKCNITKSSHGCFRT